jgi:hypothetical protein
MLAQITPVTSKNESPNIAILAFRLIFSLLRVFKFAAPTYPAAFQAAIHWRLL